MRRVDLRPGAEAAGEAGLAPTNTGDAGATPTALATRASPLRPVVAPRREVRRREDDLHESVFRALLAHFGAGKEVGPRLFFLAIRSGRRDRDPRPTLLARFLDSMADEAPGESNRVVRKVSRSRQAGGFITDRRTGQLGAILRITSVRRKGEDEARVNAEWVAHRRTGKGLALRVAREGDHWVVKDETTRWEK